MGVVYLCEDLRLPGKRWALKEMLCSDPALAAQARESFEQEAATLTGSAGRDGYQILHGVLLAQKQYNATHQDHKTVLDIYDDGSQVDRALEQAQKVAEKSEYAAGVGPFDSQRTLALALALPMVSPLTSNPRVVTSGPYVVTVAGAHNGRISRWPTML